MTLIDLVKLKLAILTILAQIGIMLSVFYLLFFRKKYSFVQKFIGKYSLLLAFIIALTATSGSLFYSEIVGFAPCVLCWYQRIFMYPQVILLGMAFWKKDKAIIDYSLALSIIGTVIAGYHYLMQLGVVSSFPCTAVGYSISCTKLFVMQFGYITLPLMSFTAFLSITVLLFLAIKLRT